MKPVVGVAKFLAVSGAILGVALLIANCLDCRTARGWVLAVCAIVMASMIGLFWYVLGKFSRSTGLDEAYEASLEEHERPQSQQFAPNTLINVSILVLGGIWIAGATSSYYPSRIPLIFLISGGVSVMLFGAAARPSSRLRAAIAPNSRRWIGVSIALATLIVIAVAAYGLDAIREHPVLSLICGALGLAMTSAGVYRSGFTKS
jgi:hypothetical protein